MFRTELPISPYPFQINHQQKLLALGSCFASTIGGKLRAHKFFIDVNPFGTLFNPHSISKLVKASLADTRDETGLVRHQGQWLHYDWHSDFSDVDSQALLARLESQMQQVKKQLQNCDLLILTWGTAFVYERKDNQAIVANCHKQPAALFEKRLLTAEQIHASFQEIYQQLRSVNSHVKFLLTLSPVRHLRDTLEMNSVSKSLLRWVMYEIYTQYQDVFYFPSYEILLDDLRDYRFYADDMLHPSAVAEDYIWEKFGEAFFDSHTLTLVKRWGKIRQALAHRPFYPESEAHQQFLRKLLKDLEKIGKEIEVSEEIHQIRSQLY